MISVQQYIVDLLQNLDEKESTKNGHVRNGSSTHERKSKNNSSNSSKHTNSEDIKKEPDYTPEQLAEVRRWVRNNKPLPLTFGTNCIGV